MNKEINTSEAQKHTEALRLPTVLVSTGVCYFMPVQEIIKLAFECGAEGVELILGPELKKYSSSRIAQWFRQSKGTYHIHAPFELSFANEKVQTECVERTWQIANEIDARLVVVHPPSGINAEQMAQGFRKYVEMLRGKLSNTCYITLENMPSPVSSWERIYDCFPTMERLSALAGYLGVKLTLDISHLATRTLPLIETHRRFQAQIINVHLSDYLSGTQHLAPGVGVLPIADYLYYLVSLDPVPAITIEFNTQTVDKPPVCVVERLLRGAVNLVKLCTEQNGH